MDGVLNNNYTGRGGQNGLNFLFLNSLMNSVTAQVINV